MDIKELFEKQRELDEFIIEKRYCGGLEKEATYDENLFLTNRLLALAVEVGELANATRAFKYWSTKESESKERLLDEYVDCLFFLASIGNTLKFMAEEVEEAYKKKYKENIRRQEEGY